MATLLSLRRDDRDTAAGSPINVIAFLMFVVPALAGMGASLGSANPYWAVAGLLIGFVLAQAPKVAAQWERAVVFRLGRYTGLRGPGLFWIVPFVETLPATIDQRVVTTGFAAEQTLTADTVPVNVDAVLFWMVHDAEKAALEVQNFRNAVTYGRADAPTGPCKTAPTRFRTSAHRHHLFLDQEDRNGKTRRNQPDFYASTWLATLRKVISAEESLSDSLPRRRASTKKPSPGYPLSATAIALSIGRPAPFASSEISPSTCPTCRAMW